MSYKFLPIDNFEYINIYFIKKIYYDHDEEILYISLFDENDFSFELFDLYNDGELSDNLLSLLDYLGLNYLSRLIRSDLKNLDYVSD